MKKSLSACFLAAALLAAAAPAGPAQAVSSGVPAMEAFSKAAFGGNEIVFSKEDFISRVSAGLRLDGIVLAGLPAPEEGTLLCGTRALLPGEAVVTAVLDELKFIPAGREDVSALFTFLPVFDGRPGPELVQVTLRLSLRENRPPVAEDFSLTTYKNIAIAKPFKGSDPDGDLLTYKITSKPKRGAAVALEDGAFRYTPYQNKTGKDSFTYVAIDPFGNTSPEARVDIQIDKPGSKLTYADMGNHPAHYAALKMAAAGVLTGEKIGDAYYFSPERMVSRGEFIVMVMALLGENAPPPVIKTGFSDDDATPVWVKPYAAAARKAGLIRGVEGLGGERELRAAYEITRAEAAVILNNALRLADTGAAVSADWDAVPVWARQPAINVLEAGVMDIYGNGVTRPDSTVSRAEAAEMLLGAQELKEKSQPSKGLLSWVFG